MVGLSEELIKYKKVFFYACDTLCRIGVNDQRVIDCFLNFLEKELLENIIREDSHLYVIKLLQDVSLETSSIMEQLINKLKNFQGLPMARTAETILMLKSDHRESYNILKALLFNDLKDDQVTRITLKLIDVNPSDNDLLEILISLLEKYYDLYQLSIREKRQSTRFKSYRQIKFIISQLAKTSQFNNKTYNLLFSYLSSYKDQNFRRWIAEALVKFYPDNKKVFQTLLNSIIDWFNN